MLGSNPRSPARSSILLTQLSRLPLVVGGLVKAERRGRFFPDGIFLTNDRAQLACQPDGTFVSHQTLKSGRVHLVEGEKEGYLELEGTPDMVLEIVSASSVEKDKETLLDLYWRARDSRILGRGRPGGSPRIRHLPTRGRRLCRHEEASGLAQIGRLRQIISSLPTPRRRRESRIQLRT